jgi:hypothetical protein
MQVQILLLKKKEFNLDSNEFGSLYLVGGMSHPRDEKKKSTKKIAIKEFMLVINLELIIVQRQEKYFIFM